MSGVNLHLRYSFFVGVFNNVSMPPNLGDNFCGLLSKVSQNSVNSGIVNDKSCNTRIKSLPISQQASH